MAPHENILVIKLGALGDFIQALGAMAGIRRHHPAARITLLTTPPFVALAEKSGYVDQVMVDRRPKWWDGAGWLSLARRLNDGRFSRVYDLQNNDRTALYFRLFRKRKRLEWVGAAPGASHQNVSPERTKGHSFDGHVQTLALAGIRDLLFDDLSWMESDLTRFNIPRPYVLMVPGCAPQHPHKRWPAAFYAALACSLTRDNYHIAVVGSKDESPLAATICEACPAAMDLTGQTDLWDLPALARGAAGSVGNDTGPMHIIGATGCPSLVLFSKAGNPARHAPKGACVAVLQEPDLADLSPARVEETLYPLLRTNEKIKT
ncbi:MAG: glycosyltransferase family 9 protein [Alphaproteobacteria bacterium]|nr:glycosyltransferase family 9 protein [Alphaproteobacteria bacterium]